MNDIVDGAEAAYLLHIVSQSEAETWAAKDPLVAQRVFRARVVMGESEQRLYSLDAWQECPYHSERERAALAWTEAVSLITEGRVTKSVYDAARSQFTERELADLTLAVSTISAWNRLSIAGRLSPGAYQPAARPLK